VLPFTDGGTGVSLVVSHALTDGVGLCEVLADAKRTLVERIEYVAHFCTVSALHGFSPSNDNGTRFTTNLTAFRHALIAWS
jgi:hypothetical protein